MSSVEALAQTLHEAQYGTPARPTDCECEHLAEHILADPSPLLAALAEAGVLTEVTAPAYYGMDGEAHPMPHTGEHETEVRRYVTDWQEVQP